MTQPVFHGTLAALFVAHLFAACGSGGQSGRCGNGKVEPGEECDGPDLAQQTCGSLGYQGGTLFCAEDCRFDRSGCTGLCGDGVLDSAEEVCDGTDLGSASCQSEGFHGGVLSCSEDCQAVVTGDCCDHECPASGSGECVGHVLWVCDFRGAGCLEWTATDCTVSAQVCDDSASAPACTFLCAGACTEPGATQCVDETNLATCIDDGQGCQRWVESACADHCGGVPPACFRSGHGTACDDLYSLDGRTFPHIVVGDFNGGIISYPGSCQTGEHPLYLSYTLGALIPGRLLLRVTDHSGPPAWPQISAWTAAGGADFCDFDQRAEIGCVTGDGETTELLLDTHGRSPGDILYIIVSGDASPYPLHDPVIVVEEIDCALPTQATVVSPLAVEDVDPRLNLVFEFLDPPVPTAGTVEIQENGLPLLLYDLGTSPSEVSWSGHRMIVDPVAPLSLGVEVTVVLSLESSICGNPISSSFTFSTASSLPPAGESCADVIPASNHGVTTVGYYEASTLDILNADLVDCRAAYSGDADSVWSFTLDAMATAVQIAITKSVRNRLVAVLVDDCLSSTTSLACATDWELPVFLLSASGLTPGARYYLVVGNAYETATFPDPGFTQFEITQFGP